MWFVMILSYLTTAAIDTKSLTKLKGKWELPLYIVLMVISYIIGTAAGYTDKIPSPAEPIQAFVKSVIGK